MTFKVVNYQVVKLLKIGWRSFCLPVISEIQAQVTNMIQDNTVRHDDNETIVVCLWTRTVKVGQLICLAHYFIGFVMRITLGILVEK